MKNIVLLMIVILICVCPGCGKEKKIEKQATEICEAIAGGNIEEINAIIFGYEKLEMSETISDSFLEEKRTGIISRIFARTDIEVKKINKYTVEYEVKSPDLGNIFCDLREMDSINSSEEFINFIGEYIDNAEIDQVLVSVPYSMEGKEVYIDYRNKEFINAITGGLLYGYQDIFEEMIADYMGEIL